MKITREIEFEKPPIVFAAWPGMGNVGLIAMDYIRRQLNAQPFAEIDMTPYFIPDSIVVKEGIAQFPDIPSSVFYFSRNPDVIIFESNAQIPGREGIAVIKALLDLVAQFHTNRIYTAAAYAQSMSYQAPSDVLAACNSPYLLDSIAPLKTIPMVEGVIAGLNGLLLGVAAARSMEAACFLGTIPSYAANIAYPKASLEIIRVFGKLLGVDFETEELEQAVASMEGQMAAIEERIKQFFPSNTEGDEEIADMEEQKVPHYVMEKIEKMFQQAEKDKSFAAELKKELDRWNLFELYENRFLDLFDDKKKDPKNPPGPATKQ